MHASLGLVLIAGCVWVAVAAVRCATRAVVTLAVTAAALVIGAAFNGVSFLDFNYDASSLVMALLALAALLCYVTALLVWPVSVTNAPS